MKGRRWSQDAYAHAYRFAARAHLGQKVPGTEISYLMHLSLVSMEVIAALGVEGAAEEDLAVRCALLHDVIEDTEVTYGQVAEAFGERVAGGVLALTKDPTLEKSAQMADSLERIRQQPREVWMVKLADRISNLGPPPHYWTPEKIAGYKQEARTIHDALHEASPYLAERLRARIAAYPPPEEGPAGGAG